MQHLTKSQLTKFNLPICLTNLIFKNSVLKNCKIILHGPIVILTLTSLTATRYIKLQDITDSIQIFGLKLNNKIYIYDQLIETKSLLYYSNLQNCYKQLRILITKPCIVT